MAATYKEAVEFVAAKVVDVAEDTRTLIDFAHSENLPEHVKALYEVLEKLNESVKSLLLLGGS